MIGVFGGTFDPVHYGHLRSALEVKELFGLDEMRLIPSASPPHRPMPSASAEMRTQMLNIAIAGIPDFIIDTRELERTGLSYMVLTLESLRQDFPAQPIILFIGSDAFKHITSWYQWPRLFDYSHIVVLTRPGYDIGLLNDDYADRLTENPNQLSQTLAGKLFFQAITQLDISATAIRNLIAKGKNPQFLLPDPVITFIKEHNLYLDNTPKLPAGI